MKSILDPRFVYVPAARTSVAKTFARIRREQKASSERKSEELRKVVSAIAGRKTGT